MFLKKKTYTILGVVLIILFIIIVQLFKNTKPENTISLYIPVVTNEVDSVNINKTKIDTIFKEYPLVYESLKNSLYNLYNKTGVDYDVIVEICEIEKSYNSQYFIINISEKIIEIKSETKQGLLNGIIRIENEIKKTSSRLIPQQITDYSSISQRSFHIGLRGNEDIDVVKKIIYNARNAYFNELVLLIRSGVGFKSLKKELTKKWKKEDLKEIIKYSNDLGIKVIPEIKLLTHQEKLFKDSYSYLMANKSTYNPDNEEVYEIVFPLIDEIIDIFQCDTFHIGHDEVAGYRKDRKEKYIRKGEVGITPKQYLKDIIKLHSYLESKGIKTMMWADMLLDREDFPEMDRSGMHGGNGFKKIIDELPKDIILGDWHYFQKSENFPTYDYLVNKGFNVYGAIWKDSITNKNFTNYINNSDFDNKVIMATAWGNINSKSNEMTEILIKTGNLIWKLK